MSLRLPVRDVDTAAWLGGDEFAVLAALQDSTGGEVLAERLAAAARDEVVPPDEPPVTLSIGVVLTSEHGDDPISSTAPNGAEVAEEAKSWRPATTRQAHGSRSPRPACACGGLQLGQDALGVRAHGLRR